MMELERFLQGTSDVDGYDLENCDDTVANKEEDPSQADEGSTQNMQDRWYSTRECEDWTEYFWPVTYDNGEANATPSEVSEAKTKLQYVTKSHCYTYMGQVPHLIYSNSGGVKCGYRPKKGINIARLWVNSYSITPAPAKSVTHMSFWWCL